MSTPAKKCDRVEGGIPSGLLLEQTRPASIDCERYGYTTRVDLYAVVSYPKADFQNEPKTQRAVTLRRKTIDTRLMLGFFAGGAAFFACVLLLVISEPAIFLAGMGLLFVLFIVLALFGNYDPALDCARCGGPLKKDWVRFQSGRSGKFLICPVCQTYVYTHRTMRTPGLTPEP